MEQIDTLVIGAGQAGLSTSYYLAQNDRDHVLLERDRIGKSWRSDRWDSFTLVTPNWMLRLPGMEYGGDTPDGFLARQEVVEHLDQFVASFDPPVKEGVEATILESAPESDAFIVHASDGSYLASNVVVATGTFQKAHRPDLSRQVSESVFQIHSRDYRSPEQLPPDTEPELDHGYEAPEITELDVGQAGISAIVWATGYKFDFSWVHLPVFDEYGYPVQERGVTPQVGLCFVGLHWLHTIKSGLFLGVADDAAYIVQHIESRA